LRFRWEMRARISQIVAATALWKSGCSRYLRRSAVARNSFLPPTIPSARRRAKSDFPKRPAARRFRRYPQAPGAAPSTPFQTAPWSSHGQTHRAAQTSTECSGCGRMPAPRLVFQDSCRSPWNFTAPSRCRILIIPSTILSFACPAAVPAVASLRGALRRIYSKSLTISCLPFVYISFLMPPTQASPNPLYSSQ